MRTLPPLRQRIPGTAGQEPGVPQFYSTGVLAYGAPHDGQGVLTPPVDRTSVPRTVSAWTSVFEGLFGRYSNQPDLSRNVSGAAQAKGAFYNYHVGDIFTPGTQNYVFETTTELTPLTTIWGNAFLRKPNTFKPLQPPQVWADYNKYVNGIGGLISGQYALQPLESVE